MRCVPPVVVLETQNVSLTLNTSLGLLDAVLWRRDDNKRSSMAEIWNQKIEYK